MKKCSQSMNLSPDVKVIVKINRKSRKQNTCHILLQLIPVVKHSHVKGEIEKFTKNIKTTDRNHIFR